LDAVQLVQVTVAREQWLRVPQLTLRVALHQRAMSLGQHTVGARDTTCCVASLHTFLCAVSRLWHSLLTASKKRRMTAGICHSPLPLDRARPHHEAAHGPKVHSRPITVLHQRITTITKGRSQQQLWRTIPAYAIRAAQYVSSIL
jgi:hypothetical protein